MCPLSQWPNQLFQVFGRTFVTLGGSVLLVMSNAVSNYLLISVPWQLQRYTASASDYQGFSASWPRLYQSHQGYAYISKCFQIALVFRPHVLMQVVCLWFCISCISVVWAYMERCGLPLDSCMPGCLNNSWTLFKHLTHYSFTRF